MLEMMETGRQKSEFFKFSIRSWGLITAAGIVASVATILAFLGSFCWFLDLFSHFRVQYFLGLGIIALLLLIPRAYKMSLLFGVLALVNLCVIVPLYSGNTDKISFEGNPVRALLVNVNTGFGSVERVAKSVQYFNPDILILEEINGKWISKLHQALVAYPYSRVEPRDDNFGISVFSKLPFVRCQTVYIGKAGVPSILAEVETPYGRCILLATHPVPPAGREYSRWRNDQLAEIPGYVNREISPVILFGDLNVSPWSPYFKRLLRDSGLRNSSQGRGIQPTWPAFNPFMWIPIDHCLYSPQISIQKKQIGPSVGSDHYPVIIDFVIVSGNK
jgi:endonuclease/exonuclease/phosphatase (EEP) superfamily protein YafD